MSTKQILIGCVILMYIVYVNKIHHNVYFLKLDSSFRRNPEKSHNK